MRTLSSDPTSCYFLQPSTDFLSSLISVVVSWRTHPNHCRAHCVMPTKPLLWIVGTGSLFFGRPDYPHDSPVSLSSDILDGSDASPSSSPVTFLFFVFFIRSPHDPPTTTRVSSVLPSSKARPRHVYTCPRSAGMCVFMCRLFRLSNSEVS